MPSPFPGMNPYLERSSVWADFHQTFLTEIRKRLVAAVGGEFIVKLDLHVYIEDPEADERRLLGRPDLVVLGERGPTRASTTVTIQAPLVVTMPAMDELEVPFIEIFDRDNQTLITVVELLSPVNKQMGGNRDAYLSKQREYFRRDVNIVEIDLLRVGPRMPYPDLPACDYCIVVRRISDWPNVGVWPIRLRDPLPTIPIPLRPPASDVSVDLKSALDVVYDEAGYSGHIYHHEPEPALSPEDQAWADAILNR